MLGFIENFVLLPLVITSDTPEVRVEFIALASLASHRIVRVMLLTSVITFTRRSPLGHIEVCLMKDNVTFSSD